MPPRRKRVRVPEAEPTLVSIAKLRAVVNAVGEEGTRVTLHDSECQVHRQPALECDCDPVSMDVFPVVEA